jgi:anti-sigma regulatory factor (Ser/Thr protein kinase)
VSNSDHAIHVSHTGDVSRARMTAKERAENIGFSEEEGEEIALVTSELATNLCKHAAGGVLIISAIREGTKRGIQVETADRGPGIDDVEEAMTDGFSTTGSLGYGLGTMLRLMDEVTVSSLEDGFGTKVICKRWVHDKSVERQGCPLDFGVATCPRPGSGLNGDAFIVSKLRGSALVGLIDGLGHGQYAHRAAQTAKKYVERHFDQPLQNLFLGVARQCRATRGVVMALARFDWEEKRLTFASIGNVEARVINSSEMFSFIMRRGVLGLNAPVPAVIEHRWEEHYIMVMHTDGLSTHWRWKDFPGLDGQSASETARFLLFKLAKSTDDATVLVMKRKA